MDCDGCERRVRNAVTSMKGTPSFCLSLSRSLVRRFKRVFIVFETAKSELYVISNFSLLSYT